MLSCQIILKAINNEDIILKSSGEQYFSYTYVTDAVAAMFYVLIHGENGVAYNISNKNCDMHLKDFAQLCASSNGKNIVFDLPSEIEQKGYSIANQAILDNQRLRDLGFEPFYDKEKAVSRTIEILK